MNYIWDVIIKAKQAGLDKKDIHFLAAKSFSPYMEISKEILNAKDIDPKVEINPFYRFSAIFQDLLNVNDTGNRELRSTVLDILIHFLAEIDLMQGMNKKEYYIRFVLKDLEAGSFGKRAQQAIMLFDQKERETIARNILRLYETGEEIFLLKDTLRTIFHHSIIYANCEEKDELLIYVGQEQTENDRTKIEMILEIFVPVRFHTEIYWQAHFGIIDVEETMRIDTIAIY